KTALTKLRRDHIGFVFQFFNLLPMLNAEENVTLPLAIAGEKPDRAWVDELLQELGIADRRTHRPAELSGGQQQRVAIGRALVSRPTVMFADEPTGNLDSTTSEEILELLREAVESYGQTTVMVTHDPRASAMADRILFLADGLIVRDQGRASAQEVLAAMAVVGGKYAGSSTGAPSLALSTLSDTFNPYTYSHGRGPRSSGEVVVNSKLADDKHLHIGQHVELATDVGLKPVTIVGVFKLGTAS